MDTIAENAVVAFHYVLTDDDGDEIDRSTPEHGPLYYLHGFNNIVPGLEAQLLGKKVGDSFKAVVEPADGYGERDKGQMELFPRSSFPPNVELSPGMQFNAQDEAGNVIPIWVVGIEGDMVQLDKNHPLAGVRLNFAIEVVEIREASPEEITHRHVHGPGGHHH